MRGMVLIGNDLVWEVKRGDLVKIRKYTDGCEDKFIYLRGIVISDISREELQQRMWPSVKVYMFDTGTVKECYPGSIEVISNS